MKIKIKITEVAVIHRWSSWLGGSSGISSTLSLNTSTSFCFASVSLKSPFMSAAARMKRKNWLSLQLEDEKYCLSFYMSVLKLNNLNVQPTKTQRSSCLVLILSNHSLKTSNSLLFVSFAMVSDQWQYYKMFIKIILTTVNCFHVGIN